MNTSILLLILILIVLIIILVIKKLSKEPFIKSKKKKKKKKKNFDKDTYDESRKFIDKLLWSKINTIDDIEINDQIMTNVKNITNFID